MDNRSFVPLPRSTPQQQAVSAVQLDRFERALARCDVTLRGYVLLRNGQLVRQRFWAPYEPEDKAYVYSMTKSFTATAVGLLVDDGELTLESRVVDYFHDVVPAGDDHWSGLRVQDLLAMASGHTTDTIDALLAARDGDWVRAFFRVAAQLTPGERFVYNSGASHVLSALVQRVAGEKLADFLQYRLFDQLGFDTVYWDDSPTGETVGGWGLMLRAEDAAKLGQLYLNGGLWNGRRILSETWVEQATRSHSDTAKPGEAFDWTLGYGYQFWMGRHNSYRADGAYGQFCIVLPEQLAVLVLLGECGDALPVLGCVWQQLLPALTSTTSSLEKHIDNKEYRLEDNQKALQTLRLCFMADRCLIFLCDADGTQAQLSAGRGAWLTTEGCFPLGRQAFVPTPTLTRRHTVSACFHWTDAQTLLVQLQYRESPHSDRLIITIDGDAVTLLCPGNQTGARSVRLTGIAL